MRLIQPLYVDQMEALPFVIKRTMAGGSRDRRCAVIDDVSTHAPYSSPDRLRAGRCVVLSKHSSPTESLNVPFDLNILIVTLITNMTIP